MAGNYLVVNADGPETRVALVEGGRVAEVLIDRSSDQGNVGHIYKGKIVRVLPGMQAAFVEVGLERAAFLYVGDVRDPSRPPALDEIPSDAVDDGPPGRPRELGRIEDLLKAGQEILVQVAKEPMGQKGARVTTHLSLPGRHLVYMPDTSHVGISRRIPDESERQRLRGIVDKRLQPGEGFIVRTAAQGASETELADDMAFLRALWNDVSKRGRAAQAPSRVFADLDLVLRTVRDSLNERIDKILVDVPAELERIREFVQAFMPALADRMELHSGDAGLFDRFSVEPVLEQSLGKRVWLKSGGYLVIDETEALTVIDVNTGRFVGKQDLEETITKNNLEACAEIAEQLRIRNLGGLIVIDFIDMEDEKNRVSVFEALTQAMATDRARSNIAPIGPMGLLEMTRKRTRESLVQSLTTACPTCEGNGFVKSRTTVAYDILRAVARQARAMQPGPLVVRVHRDIAELFATKELATVEAMQERLGRRIAITGDVSFSAAQYEIQRDSRVEK